MKYDKKSVRDIDVAGKKVLCRCDFNVPRDDEGRITDSKRIRESLPTIRYLLKEGAAVILCSHLGRPKGKFKPELSLSCVAEELSRQLSIDVPLAPDCVGEETKALAAALRPGRVLLLENLRFHPEEEKNDPEFAGELASMAEIYVSDAFGTCHRAHASTVGVASYLPAVSGFLVEKELNMMGGALTNPKRPFVAVLGGAKVSDKIGVINNLIDKADTIIIGGGMAYTFLKSMGCKIGDSLLEEDKVSLAGDLMEKARSRDVRLLVPIDNVAGDAFRADCNIKTVNSANIPDGWMGMDIGPDTVRLFQEAILNAGTVVWNGPMGVFEFPAFSRGTVGVAEAMARCNGVTIVGGGDSAAAVEQFGFADKMTHISTGGGASLEFLEGIDLPGITCLLDKKG
ncbi:MAG: phosphoglycerate kinase [Oscillospiraceae bacterium]